jgi:AraC-like DNA-binding protein
MSVNLPLLRPDVIQVTEKSGIGRNRADSTYRPPHPGITLFMEGDARITHDGILLPKPRPLLWFLPAGAEVSESVQGSFHTMWVTFKWQTLAAAPEKGTRLRFEWENQQLRVNRWKIPDARDVLWIVERFERLKSSFGSARPTASLEASAAIMELICKYFSLPDPESSKALGHRSLVKFQTIMQGQWSDDASVENLAGKAGVSEGYLRRLVRKQLGVSPVQYRNNIRLAKARELLLSTDMSIKEAAQKTGFSDQLYFSRLFRKRFGLSPRELIRKNRLLAFE